MLSVSQYNIVKGVGAGIAVLTACLNSIMEQDEIDITKIQGYYDKKKSIKKLKTLKRSKR